jgi:HD superfamily phosphohydrolase YqeK
VSVTCWHSHAGSVMTGHGSLIRNFRFLKAREVHTVQFVSTAELSETLVQ